MSFITNPIATSPAVTPITIVGATAVGRANLQAMYDCAITATMTLGAAATLGAGWFCYTRNSGTGILTIGLTGADTIDGLSNRYSRANEALLISCDGVSAFKAVILQPFFVELTSSATFAIAPGYSAVAGVAWGGGCSGFKGSGPGAGGGGGSAAVPFHISAATYGTVQTILVGAGGVGPSVTDAAMNAGGDSTIGAIFIAPGAGITTAPATTGGGGGGVISAGGDATAGLPGQGTGNQSGMSGTVRAATGTSNGYGGAGGGAPSGAAGGYAVWGGAGGAGISSAGVAAAGGVSMFGGNGGNSQVAAVGLPGSTPGGGGGSTLTGNNAGSGGNGKVRIWGVA